MTSIPIVGTMSDLGLSDLLQLVQTTAIIAALLITLYFSRRQVKAFATDLETRVLNDIYEKFQGVGEVFLQRPELIRSIYQAPEGVTTETGFSYYLLFFCAHIFHMRQRAVLADNEWTGWLQWMKNAFRYGTIGTSWTATQMESWFDPEFRDFVKRELLVEGPMKN
jgi:hypothetical protein